MAENCRAVPPEMSGDSSISEVAGQAAAVSVATEANMGPGVPPSATTSHRKASTGVSVKAGRNTTPFLERPHKLSELTLAATLVSYATGFVITNLYLGSLGIVSFTVLRVRYILTGISFSVFSGILAVLVYGLIRILRRVRGRAWFVLVGQVLLYTIQRFSVLFVVVPLLMGLAGSGGRPPVGIPRISVPRPLTEWFNEAPPRLLVASARYTGMLVSSSFALIALVLMVVLIINPRSKDGTRPSRIETVRKAVSVKSVKKTVRFVLGIFFLTLAVSGASSLVDFLMKNEIVVALELAQRPPTGAYRQASARFLVVVFCLYVIAAAWLIWGETQESSSPWANDDDPTGRPFALSSAAVIVLALVMGAYTLGVYPNLPQQLGGGCVVPVTVLASHDDLQSRFDAASAEIYLVDRTSASAIFIVVEGQNHTVLEVSSSEIVSITYDATP